MKLFANSILSFIFIFTQVYAKNAFADSALNEARFQAAIASEILNHSKNIGELLKNIRPFLTKEESTGIAEYLAKKNVGLDTPLSSFKQITNKLISSNGEEFKILDGGRVSYKGKQFKKTKALDLMLDEIEARLNSSQSLQNIFFQEAQAFDPVSLVIVALAFLVCILGVSIYNFLYSEDANQDKILGNVRASKCEKNEDAGNNKITFIAQRQEVDITANEAAAKGMPPGIFEKLFKKCLAQKSPSLTQTQIREVIKSLPSSERASATNAIRKGTAN